MQIIKKLTFEEQELELCDVIKLYFGQTIVEGNLLFWILYSEIFNFVLP